MNTELISKKSVYINADSSRVWEGLTNPELVKQYFFGTQVLSDWKKGSPILFRGEWQGKSYEDKGKLLEVEQDKLIRYNYWSSFSGTADSPENYSVISYELWPDDKGTLLTVIQQGFKTQETRNHSQENWQLVLDGLKKLLEDIN